MVVPLVAVVVVLVVTTAVVAAILKLSPSHVIPSGHGAHSSSPGATGKYHFELVCSSPLSRSTSVEPHVQEVFEAFFKL